MMGARLLYDAVALALSCSVPTQPLISSSLTFGRLLVGMLRLAAAGVESGKSRTISAANTSISRRTVARRYCRRPREPGAVGRLGFMGSS